MPRRGDVSPPSDLKGLLTVLLAVLLMAFLTSGHRACPRESMTALENIIRLLDNSSDLQLYTPEDFTETCYSSSLYCFSLELRVIKQEVKEHQDVLQRLIDSLDNLRHPTKNCTDPHAKCQPCECHREQAVPVFLRTLQRMLQWSCRSLVVPCVAKRRRVCWPRR